jgi:hypothetical protein
MPTTNNMIKLKSSEYPCFQICNVDVQIIVWICNWLKLIFRYESNEHRNNTKNQITPHKTTKNTTPQLDDEITKKHKRKTWSMWKSVIYIKRRGEKNCRWVILGQKWPKIISLWWTKKQREPGKKKVMLFWQPEMDNRWTTIHSSACNPRYNKKIGKINR